MAMQPSADTFAMAGRIIIQKKLQHEILERYALMVKPGGKLVYATCSILPSENQKQVSQFLEMNKSFLLEEERQIFPSEGFDGFYMARMGRVKE